MPRFTIRRTANADVVFALDYKMFWDTPIVDNGHMEYWLVWNDGKPIGYCATTNYGEHIFMSRCGVLPEFRGHGLQKRMIRARELFHGNKEYFTYVSLRNPASINSLISCGYKAYAPQRRYAGDEFIYLIKEAR